MRSFLSASAFCSGLLFLGSAIPGHAATIIFSNSGTGGTSDASVSVAPPPDQPNDPVVNLLGLFNTFTVTGAPSDNTGAGGVTVDVSEFYCTTTASCAGGVPGINITAVQGTMYIEGSLTAAYPGFSSPQLLATITFTGGLTADASSVGNFTLNPPTIATITPSSTLLADLGLTGVPLTVESLTGTGKGGNGSYSYVPGLELVTPVPEPGSWLTMALGAALIVIAVRRKSSKVG